MINELNDLLLNIWKWFDKLSILYYIISNCVIDGIHSDSIGNDGIPNGDRISNGCYTPNGVRMGNDGIYLMVINYVIYGIYPMVINYVIDGIYPMTSCFIITREY